MADLDLEPEQIAQLPLERREIGIDRTIVARRGSTDVTPRPWTHLLGEPLCLANAESAGDDFLGQNLGLFGIRNRPCMAHSEIASH